MYPHKVNQARKYLSTLCWTHRVICHSFSTEWQTTKTQPSYWTQVKLKLFSMSSQKTTLPCTKLEAVQIGGLFSKKRLTVPFVYTRDFISANGSHIPAPDTARAWPHLEYVTEHIAPQLDCQLGLL